MTARIKVIVEGQTEESFVNSVLGPFFWTRDIYMTPILLGVPGHKGGHVNYSRIKKDILLHLKQDPTSCCTTMFDLYGLGEGFPGQHLAVGHNGIQKALHLERAIHNDILATVPECRPELRFYPYLQVHEFESLLFSDPHAFAASIGQQSLENQLHAIRNAFPTPEEINGDPVTAPSKRVIGLYGSYKKVIEGTLAAQAVGIQTMRQQCQHFNDWITRIEGWTALG